VADFPLRSNRTEGAFVASYDFSVVAWEVQTTMHFAEKYSAYDSFDVQMIALQEDLRDPLRNSDKMFMAEDVERVVPWHLQRARGYLLEDPAQAVAEFFDAVIEWADGYAGNAFWDEARVPTFGSPPEKWEKLSEVVEKMSVPGAAYGAIIVGLHDEPVTLLLALAGLTVIIRVVDPVSSALGTGIAGKVRRAFGLPTGQPPPPQA
jgi:hypothetical protein